MNPGNVTLFATNVLSYELLSGFGGLERARGGQGRRPATRGHRGTDGCRAGQVSAPPRHRQPDPLRERNPVRPVGGGTRVTWHQESGSLGGVFGSLADTVVAKLYARDVRSNLEHAKALLEAEETR